MVGSSILAEGHLLDLLPSSGSARWSANWIPRAGVRQHAQVGPD